MEFEPPLKQAILIKRYKRFLADVETSKGKVLTIHCPNTGSMKNCAEPGSRVWYSTSANPKRKYPHTWQFIEINKAERVGINTGIANTLVNEAMEQNIISELLGYELIQAEVAYGEQKSRVDFLLQISENQLQADCYVEVKNVSLGVGNGLGLFPDAVTMRGQKHLQELIHMCEKGYRSVLFFCVQHSNIHTVSPADEIDPRYGELLREAATKGVEILAYGTEFNPQKSRVKLIRKLAVKL
ncbi:MAG TPA: DNA/RNA nuclease SfsA [Porticoccaceae bacterium]|jgi:sugar fermentation stimulation protein A|nr:DNA/RNA nuclease SfsA [Gammaproteobacteria bacterium]HIL59186.1 DNA/RNA nuclease SfsA [Porticoccaceae bacterium]